MEFKQFEKRKQYKSQKQKQLHYNENRKQNSSRGWFQPKKIFYKNTATIEEAFQKTQTNFEKYIKDFNN